MDIIRALAALSVLLTHVPLSLSQGTEIQWLLNGYQQLFDATLWASHGLHPGVVILVVLSGFCIHLPNVGKPVATINWRAFAHRRFWRIYPALLCAMCLGLVAAAVDPNNTEQKLVQFLSSASLLQGVFPTAGPAGNTIVATVVVECWLYLLYPFGLSLLQRKSWVFVFAIILVLHSINMAFVMLSEVDTTWAGRNVWALLPYWWLGALAVEFASQQKNIVWLTGSGCLGLYLSYLGTCALLDHKGSHYVKSLILSIAAAYLLAFLLIKPRGAREKGTWLRHILVAVGEQSYSIYLVHMPVFIICHALLLGKIFTDGFGYLFTTLGLVAIVTIMFYRWIESPLHKYARHRAVHVFVKDNNKPN